MEVSARVRVSEAESRGADGRDGESGEKQHPSTTRYVGRLDAHGRGCARAATCGRPTRVIVRGCV